jgi:response regulator RpfG family c-di-GMP phosphodiesterase
MRNGGIDRVVRGLQTEFKGHLDECPDSVAEAVSRLLLRTLVLGANDFLTKPLERTEVVLRVRNLLRTRELYVELMATKQTLERRLASVASSPHF